MQREEPVVARRRTLGIRHQADVRFGYQRWHERQLNEVQLTSGCDWVVSLLRRLLPCRANWRCRPLEVLRPAPTDNRNAVHVPSFANDRLLDTHLHVFVQEVPLSPAAQPNRIPARSTFELGWCSGMHKARHVCAPLGQISTPFKIKLSPCSLKTFS
jgi:hypothetical protein